MGYQQPLNRALLACLQAPKPGTPAHQALFAQPGHANSPQDDTHRATVLRSDQASPHDCHELAGTGSYDLLMPWRCCGSCSSRSAQPCMQPERMQLSVPPRASDETSWACRRAYQRAVSVPTSSLDALWRAYEGFESNSNNSNKQFTQRVLAEHRPRYQAARTALNELLRRTAQITTKALATPPGRPPNLHATVL